MIEGNQFAEIVNLYFHFLIEEFGFIGIEKKIRGNVFYDIQYYNKKNIISISYENIEDYLQVIIFILQNGELPDYDDKTRTLHLNWLNAHVLPSIDKSIIDLNNEYFVKFNSQNDFERKLLKSSKELRLCLKYSKLWK